MSDRIFLTSSLPMLLLAPIVGAFIELNLPFTDSSVLGILLIFGSVAAAAGYLASIAIENRRTRWFAAIIISAALCMVVDMATLGNVVLHQVSDSRVIRIVAGAIFFLLVASVVWLAGRKITRVIFAGSLALFASSVLVPAAAAGERPGPTIYIVLDEMIGLSGIDVALPGGRDAKEAISALLEEHGFRYFPNAYSRHYMTQRSLPAVHNYDFEDSDAGAESKYATEGAGSKLARSKLFDDVVARGDKITVFQSEHIDYCLPSVSHCETFDSFNPASEYVDYESTLLSVAFTAARTFVGSYTWGVIDAALSWLAGDRYAAIPTTYDVHGFLRWFDHFSDALHSTDSTFVYAHFLVPHAPSILDRNCRMHQRLDAGYKLMEEQGLPADEAASRREKYYGWYFEQVICLTTQLDALLNQLEKDEQWRDATVVVHGDHGSRISMASYAEHVTERDMIDNYSALYAIKGPGIEAGADSRQTSVQRLSAEYFSRSDLGGDTDTVTVNSVDPGRAILMKMPTLEPRH